MQHKLLTEPAPTTTAAERALNAIRLTTRRFGGAWPYLPAGTGPRVPLPGDPFCVGLHAAAGLSLLTAALLTPDTQVEQVEVWLQHPVELDAATAQIQRYREALRQFFYPRLVPVWPQPSEKWATFLALPPWEGGNIPICIDARQYDGRVFACVCPATVDRFTLLYAAGLAGQPVDVHSPFSEAPIGNDDDVQLHPGLCITLLPRGAEAPPILDIEVMLNFPMSWRRGPAYPVHTTTAHYCAVTEGGHRLFSILPTRSWFYREDLAALLLCPVTRLAHEPAQPRISDAAVRGWPCRTVLAAASTTGQPTDPAHLVLVDCRPLLQGWFVTWAVRGWVNERLLKEDLEAFAPPGLQVELHGDQIQQGWIYLAPGNWVTAYYVAVRTVSPASCDIGDMSSPPARVHPCVPARKIAPSASKVLHHTAVCIQAQGGGPRVEMWIAKFSVQAIRDGTWLFTPFLRLLLWATVLLLQLTWLLVIRLLLARREQLTPCQGPWRLGILGYFALVACFVVQPVSGMQISTRSTLPYISGSDSDASNTQYGRLPVYLPDQKRAGLPVPVRPLPTPCRAPCLPSRSVPECAIDAEVPEETLITLLSQSVQRDPRPYFLAATLLETLVEHFNALTSPLEGAVANSQSSQPRAACRSHTKVPLLLDPVIPKPCAEILASFPCPGKPSHLAKASDSYARVQIGNTPCGFTWGDVDALLNFRFDLRTFADLEAICPQRAEEVLAAIPSLVTESSPAKWFCYTDGSFYAARDKQVARLGWAFILVEPQLRFFAWLSGPVPDWVVKEVSQISAYHAECFALLLAHVCAAVQFNDCSIVFRSDCQSAVGLANGAKAPYHKHWHTQLLCDEVLPMRSLLLNMCRGMPATLSMKRLICWQSEGPTGLRLS